MDTPKLAHVEFFRSRDQVRLLRLLFISVLLWDFPFHFQTWLIHSSQYIPTHTKDQQVIKKLSELNFRFEESNLTCESSFDIVVDILISSDTDIEAIHPTYTTGNYTQVNNDTLHKPSIKFTPSGFLGVDNEYFRPSEYCVQRWIAQVCPIWFYND